MRLFMKEPVDLIGFDDPQVAGEHREPEQLAEGATTSDLGYEADHSSRLEPVGASPLSGATRAAVIGAGPAGLSAAYGLVNRGVSVDLFEALPAVGGLSSGLDLWGQRIDLSPDHFSSRDPRVLSVWSDLLGSQAAEIEQRDCVYYNGAVMPVRPGPLDILRHVGVKDAFDYMRSYLQAKGWPERQTFELAMISRFGPKLYDAVIGPYYEKKWGVDVSFLDPGCSPRCHDGWSLGDIAIDMFGGRSTRARQYAKPVGGLSAVYERMAAEIAARGSRVLTSTPVRRVLAMGGRVSGVELESGDVLRYDQVVSSMPLSHLMSRLPSAPVGLRASAQSLQYRNTIFVFLHVEHRSSGQRIYVPSPDFEVSRVVKHARCNGVETGKKVMSLEYDCYDTDTLWHESDSALIDRAVREALALGVVKQPRVAGSQVYRATRTQPVYRRAYQANVDAVREYLGQIDGLTVIGRCGLFKETTPDLALLMGELAAENIAHGSRYDLWRLDVGYAEYPENHGPARPQLRIVDGGEESARCSSSNCGGRAGAQANKELRKVA